MKSTLLFCLLVLFITCSPSKNIDDMGTTYPGFDESYLLEEEKLLQERLVQLPIISQRDITASYTYIIQPNGKAKSWKDIPFNDPNKNTFLITPGDYRSWGPLRLTASGTKAVPKQICYYNPSTKSPEFKHPVNQTAPAILESFNLVSSDNWIIQGLTFSGKGRGGKDRPIGGTTNFIDNHADHNIIDHCLIEKVLSGNALRIRTSDFNIIQNCVIRDKINYSPSSDNIGITISAYAGQESRGNRIVNNEIYNYTDGIQFNYKFKKEKGPKPHLEKSGEITATLIAHNDIYITPDLYIYENNQILACAENGIDLKNGTASQNPEDFNIISENKMWGFRESKKGCGASGSVGDAMVIHSGAAGIVVKNNIIFDSTRGIKVKIFNPNLSNRKIQNITIENNLLFDIRKYSERGDGVAFMVGSDTKLINNTIVDADQLMEQIGSPRITSRKNINLKTNKKKVKYGPRKKGFAEPQKSNEKIVFPVNKWTNKKEKTLEFSKD